MLLPWYRIFGEWGASHDDGLRQSTTLSRFSGARNLYTETPE
jgi:hypothetical protein